MAEWAMSRLGRRRLLSGLAASALAGVGGIGAWPRPARAAGPDILLLLIDDADDDDMRTMPTANDVVGGTEYPNMILTTPQCAPSRATLLSGQFAHNTGVQKNSPGWGIFGRRADRTVITAIKAAGYTTAYVGKLMNGYAGQPVPGLDHKFIEPNPRYSINGTYSTDLFAEQAVGVINGLASDESLFMVVGFNAPHDPAIPAPEDEDADVGSTASPLIQRRRRTLLSVDRAITQIRDAMEAKSRWDGALVIFMSDNGFIFPTDRPSRKRGKGIWYNEAIQVRARIRYPGGGGPAVDGRLVANIDIAPTMLRVAGADELVDWTIDGRALQDQWFRKTVLISGRSSAVGDTKSNEPFDGLKTFKFTYVNISHGGKKRRDEYHGGGGRKRNSWKKLSKGRQRTLQRRLRAFMRCSGVTCRQADQK